MIISAANALKSAYDAKPTPAIFAGPDGFVDEIIKVVETRHSVDSYTPIRTIADYARRLAGAAGKSTNVEFVVEQVKSGGNGPLMCEAMGALGARVDYVGAIGWPGVHPLFERLASFGRAIPVAPPALTLAAEFEDGKIMHGKHESLRQLTWPNLVERMGGIPALDETLAAAQVVALVNWTMVPFLNDIFRGVHERVVALGDRAPLLYFFDLCDPEKRTAADLREALHLIGSFTGPRRSVILGLNEKESLEVCAALGLEPGGAEKPDLVRRAQAIAGAMGAGEVVIHPIRCAAAWTAGNEGFADGAWCAAPKLTTGAGDHFNGGYVFARALGLRPAQAIIIGKCVSGFYVRNARGPSVAEVVAFATAWEAGTLDGEAISTS
mgnify:CR=1 FL=1